jgi:hypothetical protein
LTTILFWKLKSVPTGTGTNVQTSRSIWGGTTKDGIRSRMVLAPSDAEGLPAPAIMAATSRIGRRRR